MEHCKCKKRKGIYVRFNSYDWTFCMDCDKKVRVDYSDFEQELNKTTNMKKKEGRVRPDGVESRRDLLDYLKATYGIKGEDGNLFEDIMSELAEKSIELTDAEIQSKHDRVSWAETLIKQLPESHEGRCSWLKNYGRTCMCGACKDGTTHRSDCAVHNEPAERNGKCDCKPL